MFLTIFKECVDIKKQQHKKHIYKRIIYMAQRTPSYIVDDLIRKNKITVENNNDIISLLFNLTV